MGSGVTGQIPLVALLHVEMLPSNKLDNATIHQNPMVVSHVKEMLHKQLNAHLEIVQWVSMTRYVLD
jgi:hypothetical protein